MRGFADGGSGDYRDEDVPLAELVDQFNERFGTEFTHADQLFFDQVEAEASADEDVIEAVMANSRQDFEAFISGVLPDMYFDRMEGNERVVNRMLSEREMQAMAERNLAGRGQSRGLPPVARVHLVADLEERVAQNGPADLVPSGDAVRDAKPNHTEEALVDRVGLGVGRAPFEDVVRAAAPVPAQRVVRGEGGNALPPRKRRRGGFARKALLGRYWTAAAGPPPASLIVPYRRPSPSGPIRPGRRPVAKV